MSKSNSATSVLNPSGDKMSWEQVLGLDDAALQSGALLEEGLKRLEEEYRENPEMLHGILWSLSQGVELLLKLTLWLFGEDEESIGRHHDIPALLDQLLPLVPHESLPPGRREFLEGDPLFRRLIEILGGYGGAGKYDPLDAAIGRTKRNAGEKSSTERWDQMGLDILDDNWLDFMQREPARFVDEYYPHLYRVVATSLALGVHSLWWLWVHGPTAEHGRRWHSSLTGAAWRRVSDLAMRSGS